MMHVCLCAFVLALVSLIAGSEGVAQGRGLTTTRTYYDTRAASFEYPESLECMNTCGAAGLLPGSTLEAGGDPSYPIHTVISFCSSDGPLAHRPACPADVISEFLSVVPLNASAAGFTVSGLAYRLPGASFPQQSLSLVKSASGAYPCCARVAINVTDWNLDLVQSSGQPTFTITSNENPPDMYANLELGIDNAPRLVVTGRVRVFDRQVKEARGCAGAC